MIRALLYVLLGVAIVLACFEVRAELRRIGRVRYYLAAMRDEEKR